MQRLKMLATLTTHIPVLTWIFQQHNHYNQTTLLCHKKMSSSNFSLQKRRSCEKTQHLILDLHIQNGIRIISKNENTRMPPKPAYSIYVSKQISPALTLSNPQNLCWRVCSTRTARQFMDADTDSSWTRTLKEMPSCEASRKTDIPGEVKYFIVDVVNIADS